MFLRWHLIWFPHLSEDQKVSELVRNTGSLYHIMPRVWWINTGSHQKVIKAPVTNFGILATSVQIPLPLLGTSVCLGCFSSLNLPVNKSCQAGCCHLLSEITCCAWPNIWSIMDAHVIFTSFHPLSSSYAIVVALPIHFCSGCPHVTSLGDEQSAPLVPNPHRNGSACLCNTLSHGGHCLPWGASSGLHTAYYIGVPGLTCVIGR